MPPWARYGIQCVQYQRLVGSLLDGNVEPIRPEMNAPPHLWRTGFVDSDIVQPTADVVAAEADAAPDPG